MLQLVKSWDHSNRHTAWIVKRAILGLLNKGDKEAFSIFSLKEVAKVKLEKFSIEKRGLKLGDTLQFVFELTNEVGQPQKLVIVYGIHYAKSSGNSRKVFKLKECVLQPDEQVLIKKKQLFQDLTTRKHYAGIHVLDIIINGETMAAWSLN